MAFVAFNVTIMASHTFKYNLPILEGIPGEEVVHSPLLPSFVNFKYPEYTILPNSVNNLGVTTIKGEIRSYYKVIRFSLKINVTN
jgi:hypothetical protein